MKMKEIDNFNKIKDILDFSSDDGYYFLDYLTVMYIARDFIVNHALPENN